MQLVKSLLLSLCIGLTSLASFAMQEASTVIKYETKKEAKAIALIGHGLNTKPKVMEEVIAMLNEQGITCLLAQLSGHREDSGDLMTAENWLKDWDSAFREAQQMATYAGVRFFVVAHSMGCLVNNCHLASTEDVSGLAGCIYLAPADGLKVGMKSLLALASNPLMIALSGGKLGGMGKMFAGSNAAQEDIPLCAFASLDKLLKTADSSEYSEVPTLCFVDRQDALVDIDYLSDKFTSWRVIELETAGPSMAHMCVYESHPGFCQIQVTVPEFIEECMVSETIVKPGKKGVKTQVVNPNGCAQQ